MSNWNTSNYQQRKAERRNQRVPQWYTNPDTKEKFLIRYVGAMAYAVAGFAPSSLTKEALAGWKEHGVEVEDQGQNPFLDPKVIEEGLREQRMLGRVVHEASVIPTLFVEGELLDEIKARALNNCEIAFANDEDWKTFSKEQKLERAAAVVLDIGDLEDSDLVYIFQAATGQVNTEGIPLQGGQVMRMADLKSLRKKPGRRPRTGTGG